MGKLIDHENVINFRIRSIYLFALIKEYLNSRLGSILGGLKMGKYDVLGQYLGELRKELRTLSFSEVEEVLGFHLPISARTHRPWWANDETHVQAIDGWLSVGWKAESVNLTREMVTFRKSVKKKPERTPYLLHIENHEKIAEKQLTPRAFEDFARFHMSAFFGKELRPRKKGRWPKLFDMVSEDYQIVGDAKYMTMVRGKRLPPAKFSVIAEHVWMLENIDATTRFLIFGNDKRVPGEWIKRYGKFVRTVKFFFLTKDGKITELN